MTKATVYDIYVENFSDSANSSVQIFSFSVTLTDADNNPLPNLTNAYSIFNVKQSYSAANTILSVSTETGNITIDDVSGVVTVTFFEHDLATVPRNREEVEYVYDWDLVDNQDKFYRILKGNITFAGDI